MRKNRAYHADFAFRLYNSNTPLNKPSALVLISAKTRSVLTSELPSLTATCVFGKPKTSLIFLNTLLLCSN